MMNKHTQDSVVWRDILPTKWLRRARWVNGTPHLTDLAARVHMENVQPVDDMEGFWLAVDAIKGSNLLPEALEFYDHIAYDWSRALEYITHIPKGAATRLRLLRERLLSNKLEWNVDPTFGENGKQLLQEQLERSLQWAEQLESNSKIIADFERKMAIKYAANQNIRTAAEYARTARSNYSPNRKGWREQAYPQLEDYDRALIMHYNSLLSDNPTSSEIVNNHKHSTIPQEYLDAMNSTQRNTYGGAPFYITMDEFVNSEPPENPEEEDLKYVTIYDFFATIYFLLPPRFKRLVPNYYQYSPLERIQHGKLLEGSVFGKQDKTKQRVIQAEPAVISHASKQFHDIELQQVWMSKLPLSADKYGEEDVSHYMKDIVNTGSILQREHPSLDVWLAGCDYFNFDATQNAILANDAYYNVLRMTMPNWYNYWIIDPYFIVSQFMPTWLPGVGTQRSTGVKSGQQVTNQQDSYVANFSDCYELVTWPSFFTYSVEVQEAFIVNRMVNGDDRYKITPFSAEHIEKADLQLGLVSQKQKQEMFSFKRQKISELKVTYLKTIVYYDRQKNSLIRTSSIAADVLGRYTRERIRKMPAPACVIVDAIMAGSRAVDHPDLTLLKDFINQFQIGRDWLSHKISSEQLLNAAAIEEMEQYRLTKGKKWLARSGFNAEDAIQKLYAKFGMVPGSYNFQKKYAGDDGKLSFNKLPIVGKLLASN